MLICVLAGLAHMLNYWIIHVFFPAHNMLFKGRNKNSLKSSNNYAFKLTCHSWLLCLFLCLINLKYSALKLIHVKLKLKRIKLLSFRSR